MTDRDIVQRAVALAKSGKREHARQILRQLLQKDTDNLNAWVAMAQLSRSRVEAIYCLQQVLRLRPGNPWATTHIRRLDIAKGQELPSREVVTEEKPIPRTEEEVSEDDLFVMPAAFKASDGFPFEPPPGVGASEERSDSFLDPLAGISSDDEMGRSQTTRRRRLLLVLIISLVLVLVVAAVLWGTGQIPY